MRHRSRVATSMAREMCFHPGRGEAAWLVALQQQTSNAARWVDGRGLVCDWFHTLWSLRSLRALGVALRIASRRFSHPRTCPPTVSRLATCVARWFSCGAASAVATWDGVLGAMRAPLRIQTSVAHASRSEGDERAGELPRSTLVSMRAGWVGCEEFLE